MAIGLTKNFPPKQSWFLLGKIDINYEFGSGSRKNFSLTPYYRRYFSNRFATGFFIEGFGMLHNYEKGYYYYDHDTNYNYDRERGGDKKEFALGMSIGKKYVTKKGFVVEIYLGLGRNLLSSNNYVEIVGRGGLSIGYRF